MSAVKSLLEVWQRGSLPYISPLLQPVAHTLLQAREELNAMILNFPDNLLWQRPASVASPGFHLQHLSGVLDRVFTYAKGEALNETQLEQLYLEDQTPADFTVILLTNRFNEQVDKALLQLKATEENILTDFRGVGRKLLPSTVIGLLFHGAEHTMRHLGQLMITIKFLKHQNNIAD